MAVATPCWPAPVSAITRVLPEAPCQERLPERVVDLVGTGVGEVLALEVDPEPGRQAGRPVRRPGALEDVGREPVGAVDGRRTSRVRREEGAQLGPEDRVVAEPRVRILELAERGDERLGDVAAAERPVHSPATGRVRIDESRVDGLGPGGHVGPVEARRAGTFREQRDGERILGRPLTGVARAFDPRRHVHPDGRHGQQRGRDVGRVEPARQDDRDLARHGRRDGRVRARAGPARVRPAGRVEEDPLGAGGEVRLRPGERVGRGNASPGSGRGQVHDDPRGSRRRRDPFLGLPARVLDDVRIDVADDRGEQRRVGVRGDRHHGRGLAGRRARPGQTREVRALGERDLAGRAGHEVQADGVRPGGPRRLDPRRVHDAADLHQRGARDGTRVVGDGSRRHERGGGGTGVGRAHQRLADEGGVVASGPPASQRPDVADTGLGDGDPVGRDVLAEANRAVRVHRQRSQVATVDGDQARAGGERRVELPFRVDLHERLQPEIPRAPDQVRQAPRRMERRDEEHEVGTRRAQDWELAGIDHELLGQDGHGDRGAHRGQVRDRAPEPVRLAQHGDCRRAARGIGAGAGDEVVGRRDRARRG